MFTYDQVLYLNRECLSFAVLFISMRYLFMLITGVLDLFNFNQSPIFCKVITGNIFSIYLPKLAIMFAMELQIQACDEKAKCCHCTLSRTFRCYYLWLRFRVVNDLRKQMFRNVLIRYVENTRPSGDVLLCLTPCINIFHITAPICVRS